MRKARKKKVKRLKRSKKINRIHKLREESRRSQEAKLDNMSSRLLLQKKLEKEYTLNQTLIKGFMKGIKSFILKVKKNNSVLLDLRMEFFLNSDSNQFLQRAKETLFLMKNSISIQGIHIYVKHQWHLTEETPF